ncbi:MAG: hypothetical protein RQ745_11590 [Longimicrobiales bacterium]|nr:hypothetical protein [Longimicrobiales bacterium]
MNEAAGFVVFEFTGVIDRSDDSRGVVEIRVRDDIGDALGTAFAIEEGCQYFAESGYSCAPRWIRSAEIYLRDKTGQDEIIHELLHALGLDHTCVVRSVMATEFDDADLRRCGRARSGLGLTQPLMLERRLGPHDIVALHLLRELAEVALDWRGDFVSAGVLRP